MADEMVDGETETSAQKLLPSNQFVFPSFYFLLFTEYVSAALITKSAAVKCRFLEIYKDLC